MTFDPSGELVAVGCTDGDVVLASVPGLHLLGALVGATHEAAPVLFSRDGKYIIAQAADCRVHLWSVAERRRLAELGPEWTTSGMFAVTPKDRILILGFECDGIDFRSLVAGETLKRLAGHSASLFSLCVSADGRLLATGGGQFDRTIRLWGIPDGESVAVLDAGSNWVSKLTFSHDSKRIVGQDSQNNARLWEIPSGRLIWQRNSVASVALTPDSTALLTAEDGKLRLWALSDGRARYEVAAAREGTYRIAISSDCRRLVSAAVQGVMEVWCFVLAELVHGSVDQLTTSDFAWVRGALREEDLTEAETRWLRFIEAMEELREATFDQPVGPENTN